ncbi:MAG: hypothetical protein QW806_09275 [Nitrososphaerota archaeon]
MGWYPVPFNYYGKAKNQVKEDLDKANENFQQLAQAFVNNDPTTLRVKDSDKLDGFDSAFFLAFTMIMGE